MIELYKSIGGVFSGTRVPACCQMLENMACLAAAELRQERPFHSLTVGMMKSKKGMPRMRLKATQARRFLFVLRFMLAKCFDMSTDYARLRYDCVNLLAKVYETMDSWRSDGSSARDIAYYGRCHVILFAELAQLKPKCFHLVPKHHLFLHVVEQVGVRGLNPQLLWNYSEENEIGVASKGFGRHARQPSHFAYNADCEVSFHAQATSVMRSHGVALAAWVIGIKH